MNSRPKVAILGAGMLGGSLALALGRSGIDSRLWGRRESFIAEAEAAGIAGATNDISVAVQGADIVVLATPVGAMRQVLARALPELCEGGVLVTDMGSVKVHPDEEIRPLFDGTAHRFIGSHPMAGSEQAGVGASNAQLLSGATIILTPRPEDAVEDIAVLTDLWTAIGATVTQLSAAAHDEAVARISHYPHALASVCAHVALEDPAHDAFAAGGLRDTSRVAGGEPGMWTEIMLENSAPIIDSLRAARLQIDRLITQLELGDREGVQAFLAEAKARRDRIGYQGK